MQRSVLFISLLVNLIFVTIILFKANSKQIKHKNKQKQHLNETKKTITKPKEYQKYQTDMFDQLELPQNSIIFLGNSLIDYGKWTEMFRNRNVFNRGVAGDNTNGILRRLSKITNSKPKKIFLLIGINDILEGKHPIEIAKNYKQILNQIKTESPNTKVFTQSLLPVNSDLLHTEITTQGAIIMLNEKIEELTKKFNYTYVDLYNTFVNAEGKLDTQFTNDGVHINANAYMIWKQQIEKHVN